MKQKRFGMLVMLGMMLLVLSACGTSSQTESKTNEPEAPMKQPKQEILIIIDQTPKPSEQKSFDFVVKQLPEGYTLTEMQWNGSNHQITNTLQEAAQHGTNGKDGFYISGDGQFAGFMYPKSMSGETGEAKFLFHNEQGDELTWSKKITLK